MYLGKDILDGWKVTESKSDSKNPINHDGTNGENTAQCHLLLFYLFSPPSIFIFLMKIDKILTYLFFFRFNIYTVEVCFCKEPSRKCFFGQQQNEKNKEIIKSFRA